MRSGYAGAVPALAPPVALAYGLSWGLAGVFYLLGGRFPDPARPLLSFLFALAYMWGPGVSALFFAHRQGLRLPVRGRPNRYWLWAWGLPPVWVGLAALLTLPLAGWRGLGPMKAAVGGPLAALPDPVFLLLLLLQALLAAATVNLVFALGEELFWRGYLWERLKGQGFWSASLTIGLLWGLWHAPLILLFGYHYPEHRLLGVFLMALLATLLTPAHLWVRVRGGSLLPAALLHGGVNAVAGLPLLLFSGGDLTVGFTGLPGMAVLAGFNLWLRREVPVDPPARPH